MGPFARVALCEIAQVPEAVLFEVRVLYEDAVDNLVRTQMTGTLNSARRVAGELKASALASGFKEV